MLSRFSNAVVSVSHRRHEIAHTDAPSDVERRHLTDRRELLIGCLTPSDFDEVRRRVARLFGYLPAIDANSENAAALVDDFAKLIRAEPLWAIEAACISVLNSGAKFRPSGPEFLALCRREASGAHAELQEVVKVLSADIYRAPDPDERNRVTGEFRELISQVGLGPVDPNEPKKPLSPEQLKAEAIRAVADGFYHLQKPLVPSNRLAASNRNHQNGLNNLAEG